MFVWKTPSVSLGQSWPQRQTISIVLRSCREVSGLSKHIFHLSSTSCFPSFPIVRRIRCWTLSACWKQKLLAFFPREQRWLCKRCSNFLKLEAVRKKMTVCNVYWLFPQTIRTVVFPAEIAKFLELSVIAPRLTVTFVFESKSHKQCFFSMLFRKIGSSKSNHEKLKIARFREVTLMKEEADNGQIKAKGSRTNISRTDAWKNAEIIDSTNIGSQ